MRGCFVGRYAHSQPCVDQVVCMNELLEPGSLAGNDVVVVCAKEYARMQQEILALKKEATFMRDAFDRESERANQAVMEMERLRREGKL
jgi:hypothetical protein